MFPIFIVFYCYCFLLFLFFIVYVFFIFIVIVLSIHLFSFYSDVELLLHFVSEMNIVAQDIKKNSI